MKAVDTAYQGLAQLPCSKLITLEPLYRASALKAIMRGMGISPSGDRLQLALETNER
jgi:hypothetical protein